jgi:hypothetical protein
MTKLHKHAGLYKQTTHILRVHVAILIRNVVTYRRLGQVAGSCECGNEPPGSIKCGEFLD